MAQRATILDGTVTFEKVATASDEIGLLESTPAFFFLHHCTFTPVQCKQCRSYLAKNKEKKRETRSGIEKQHSPK